MISAGIVGGTGYVAGELLRVLQFHPEVQVEFVYSRSQAGKKIASVHTDLFLWDDLLFTDKIDTETDVVFLCLGHGNSSRFLKEHPFSSRTRIIDLSNDFRLQKNRTFGNRTFVYGLTEKNADSAASAENIANPGCFATAVQLALLPLAHHHLLEDEIHVHGITGSTGAGRGLSETTHYSWRNNNVSVYKAFTHQHLGEINETLEACQPGFKKSVNFIPVRGNFTRGIFISAYTTSGLSGLQLIDMYKSFYADKVFTKVSDHPVHLKQVVNTNYCLLHVEKHGNKALITAVIDNLLKGAAGQAIENMNLMFGLQQDAGLKLKAGYF